MSRLPHNMRQAEVPLSIGAAPATALEGEVVEVEAVTAVLNGEPVPATVKADTDPHNPKRARLVLEDSETEEIYRDEVSLPDDSVDSLLDQVGIVEVPPPDREIVAELGRVSAERMIGGVFFGVEGDRIVDSLGYEPATTSYEADIQRGARGEPIAVVRKFELE